MTWGPLGKGSFSNLCKGRTKSSPAKSHQLCLGLSNNSGAQQESPCLSEKAKRGPPKVYQSGLRLLWGTGDFKGQIPVPKCIRHQDKVTTATAAGPYCLFRWDGSDSHQYLLQQREANAQEGEKRKETRHAQMLAALQGSPVANPESLKDKAWGKCLSVDRWDIGPKTVQTVTSLLKQISTNIINWDIEKQSYLGTQEPQDQVPSLPSWWFNRTEVACLIQLLWNR